METGSYSRLLQNGRAMGGMMEMLADDIPAHWMVYFAVENTGETLYMLTENGGHIHFSPAMR